MRTGTLGSLKALVHRNTFPNGDQQEITCAVENGILYTIGLNAASIQELNNGRKVFEAFLASFTPLSVGKRFSKEEISAGFAAKDRRLAELAERLGNRAEAIGFVNEGLAWDPNNAELRAMLATLQASSQPDDSTRHRDTKYGFSIALPKDWQQKPSASAEIAVKVVYKTSSQLAMITVTVIELHKDSKIDSSYLEGLKKAFRKSDLSFDDAGLETINGENAAWAIQTIEALSLRSLNYYFIKGGRLYSISAASAPSQFSYFESTFRKCIASFRFDS